MLSTVIENRELVLSESGIAIYGLSPTIRPKRSRYIALPLSIGSDFGPQNALTRPGPLMQALRIFQKFTFVT